MRDVLLGAVMGCNTNEIEINKNKLPSFGAL
jgi:hypothetical protein